MTFDLGEYWKQVIATSPEEAARRREAPPFGEIAWSVLSDNMLEIVQRAGTRWLWEASFRLPESGLAVASVRRAWIETLSVPWPPAAPLGAALEATISAMKLDWPLTHPEFGVSILDDAALYLVRHSSLPLNSLRGLIAARAAQNDECFFAKLANALADAKRSNQSGGLARAIVTHWLPLSLWLMDDANGADFLSYACGKTGWSVAAYRKARQRLKLFRHPSLPIRSAQKSADVEGRWHLKLAPELKRARCQS